MSRFLIFAALAAALAGCATMVPEYERPEFAAPESWPEGTDYITPEGAEAAAEIAWPEFFAAPELREVIATALANNRDLRIAALNIEEARALYRVQRADLLPSVDGSAGATFEGRTDDIRVPGQDATSDIYTAGVGLSQYELDVFGRIRSLNEAALNQFLATAAARNTIRNALIAETVNTYLRLLADLALLDLTRQTLAAQEQTHNLLARSLEEGVATDLDLARAATAVETARVNLHRYQRLVDQDRNALILLMGVETADGEIPAATLAGIRLQENLAIGLPSEVLLSRPDVRQAEYELLALNANIGAARAAFFPTISLTGSVGLASDSLTGLFGSGGFGAWSFGPRITVPIFEAGRNEANLEVAEVRKQQGVANYERAIQIAFREVADELAARRTLTEELRAQERLVAATERVYTLSKARYDAGIDSFLGVLDAQRELYTAEQNEILIERQRLANLVNLYRVLGGGTPEAQEVESPLLSAPAE